MQQLLECYAKVGIVNERKIVRVNGTPVRPDLLVAILEELRIWSDRHENQQLQERPFIHAEKYMILRSPSEFERMISIGSSKAGMYKIV